MHITLFEHGFAPQCVPNEMQPRRPWEHQCPGCFCIKNSALFANGRCADCN